MIVVSASQRRYLLDDRQPGLAEGRVARRLFNLFFSFSSHCMDGIHPSGAKQRQTPTSNHRGCENYRDGFEFIETSTVRP
jgi:hypothetical protein